MAPEHVGVTVTIVVAGIGEAPVAADEAKELVGGLLPPLMCSPTHPLPTPPSPPIKGMLTIEDSGFAAFGHPACLLGTGPSEEKRAKGDPAGGSVPPFSKRQSAPRTADDREPKPPSWTTGRARQA
jgi:hypothetical protein